MSSRPMFTCGRIHAATTLRSMWNLNYSHRVIVQLSPMVVCCALAIVAWFVMHHFQVWLLPLRSTQSCPSDFGNCNARVPLLYRWQLWLVGGVLVGSAIGLAANLVIGQVADLHQPTKSAGRHGEG
jgi:hypothetical protein